MELACSNGLERVEAVLARFVGILSTMGKLRLLQLLDYMEGWSIGPRNGFLSRGAVYG
jgi:hypothetical protein